MVYAELALVIFEVPLLWPVAKLGLAAVLFLPASFAFQGSGRKVSRLPGLATSLPGFDAAKLV